MLIGILIGTRYIVFFVQGVGKGHIQSLILASMMIIIGVQSIMLGLQGDIIATNRKLLEDIQYGVRKINYDNEGKR